jgi:uncharacterized protein (TIGR02266 family)
MAASSDQRGGGGGDASTASLRIKLKYRDENAFVEKFGAHVTRNGIFLATRSIKPPGTVVRFELLLADGKRLMRGEGVVTWTREHDPAQPTVPAGMGLRYSKLDAESRKLLDRIAAHKRKKGLKEESGVPAAPMAIPESGPVAVSSPATQAPVAPPPAASAPERPRPDESDETGETTSLDATLAAGSSPGVASPALARPQSPPELAELANPDRPEPPEPPRPPADTAPTAAFDDSGLPELDDLLLARAIVRARELAHAAGGEGAFAELERLLEAAPASDALSVGEASQGLAALLGAAAPATIRAPRRTLPDAPPVAAPAAVVEPAVAPPAAPLADGDTRRPRRTQPPPPPPSRKSRTVPPVPAPPPAPLAALAAVEAEDHDETGFDEGQATMADAAPLAHLAAVAGTAAPVPLRRAEPDEVTREVSLDALAEMDAALAGLESGGPDDDAADDGVDVPTNIAEVSLPALPPRPSVPGVAPAPAARAIGDAPEPLAAAMASLDADELDVNALAGLARVATRGARRPARPGDEITPLPPPPLEQSSKEGWRDPPSEDGLTETHRRNHDAFGPGGPGDFADGGEASARGLPLDEPDDDTTGLVHTPTPRPSPSPTPADDEIELQDALDAALDIRIDDEPAAAPPPGAGAAADAAAAAAAAAAVALADAAPGAGADDADDGSAPKKRGFFSKLFKK